MDKARVRAGVWSLGMSLGMNRTIEMDRTIGMDRTIFHVDVNSAFLSWSALKRLQEEPGSVDLRTIPSAVGGDVKTRHGVITAKSIPAGKMGVRTGEPVVKALQKCPQLVLVRPDFETYHDYSCRLMEILQSFTPVIQQVSVDEAYLDMTGIVKPDDRAAAQELALQIRQTVFGQLGFTVNVGISTNKLLAKMASDFQKPDRTHTLYPDEIEEKMWPLPMGELHGCGRSTAQKLYNVGILTIGDAAGTGQDTLQSLLGEKAGAYIWRSANGISTSAVKPEREQAKSVSNERTLAEDVDADNYDEKGVPVIRALAEKVAGRLQKSGLEGQTVTLQIKTGDFERRSTQTVLTEPTDSAAVITKTALTLGERLLRDGFLEQGISIRLIGVGVSKLTNKEVHQMDLFEWEDQVQQEERERVRRAKEERLGAMMVEVNSRYGKGTLEKGMPGQ